MRKLLYTALLLTALTSCTKTDEYYAPTEATVQDMVERWKVDAIYIGGYTPSEADAYVDDIEFEFEEGAEGYLGWAWPSSKVVRINSIYWKGSGRNQNTVYHEIGHVLGLHHGDTPVMEAYNQAGNDLQALDEYFRLIRDRNE